MSHHRGQRVIPPLNSEIHVFLVITEPELSRPAGHQRSWELARAGCEAPRGPWIPWRAWAAEEDRSVPQESRSRAGRVRCHRPGRGQAALGAGVLGLVCSLPVDLPGDTHRAGKGPAIRWRKVSLGTTSPTAFFPREFSFLGKTLLWGGEG